MDEMFAQEVNKREGDELMSFLLDTMPLYRRATETNDPYELQVLTGEFCSKYRHIEAPIHLRSARDNRAEVTMQGCGFCSSPVVCVDTELACLVCTTCGHQGPVGLEHSYMNHTEQKTPQWLYEPSKHMRKHLLRVQGKHMPLIPPVIVHALRHELATHQIATKDVTPFDVYRALQRLHQKQLYPHRWAVTCLLNPDYRPLQFSQAFEDRLVSLFQGCHKRFREGVYNGEIHHKRKFYAYTFFLECALEYVGVSTDKHFTPRRRRRNNRQKTRAVMTLLRDVMPVNNL